MNEHHELTCPLLKHVPLYHTHTHTHTRTHKPHKAKGPEKGGGGSCPVCFISSGRIIQPVSLMSYSLLPSHPPPLSPESLNFFSSRPADIMRIMQGMDIVFPFTLFNFFLFHLTLFNMGTVLLFFFVRFLFSASTAVFIIYLFLPSFLSRLYIPVIFF